MVKIDRDLLCEQALLQGVLLDGPMLECFEITANMMVERNKDINLTAITDPTDIVIKHFIDSLTLSRLLPQNSFSLIDVGTGAGYPGIPLTIVRRDIRLTLLDSTNKRLVYLDRLCREIGVQADLVHARAEQAGHQKEMREIFDVATARGVANLPALCELCLPLVRVGGKFIAMKSSEVQAETAQNAAALLGARHVSTKICFLRDNKEIKRNLFVYDKIAKTPLKYPRIYSKIKKQPL